ncbi:MAG: methyltransferase [Prevotella sp.]|nr:methyltransferase [Prevotella sp.]
MANDYFRFKQFTVSQSCCAMKVGTDGTLLGAWARGGRRVLDIGTGTGLIALMMAQRFPGAAVVGIDIDAEAVEQARQNAADSPFADRITMQQADVCRFEGQFDAIVCNPPYFDKALLAPESRRALARHSVALSYAQLVACSRRLLTPDGELSVVVPYDCRQRLESEALLAGFFKSREWGVKTSSAKPPKRCLMAFRLHSCTLEKGEGCLQSEWYKQLTNDFYL